MNRTQEQRSARPVRTYRRTRGEQFGNAIAGLFARVGIGPVWLLSTRGRRTGHSHTTPVSLVELDGKSWLVAPYGTVSWALNARASGQVTIRRGRTTRAYGVREVRPDEAAPILKRYISIAGATRPYFEARKDAPVDAFLAEAQRHPVFELSRL